MKLEHSYINIHNSISLAFAKSSSPLSTFLEKEYSYCVVDRVSNPDICIDWKEDSINKDAYIVNDPVSYDDRGVFLFDRDYRICRISMDRVGEKGLEILCDPAFNPHFFAIILEAILSVYFFKKDKLYNWSIKIS